MRMTFRQGHHSYSLLRGKAKKLVFISSHLAYTYFGMRSEGVESTKGDCILKLDTIIQTLHKAIL